MPGSVENREDAKKALHRVIITALENCSRDAKLNPAFYSIIARAIMDQLTQPQVAWVLKELSTPLR